jgi:hypothetical protein
MLRTEPVSRLGHSVTIRRKGRGKMANLRADLEEAEQFYGERIERIVVGKHYNQGWGVPAGKDENTILTREEGLAKLDLEYNNGFGGADCFPFFAWTKSRVFFVHEYDGATGVNWVPRNPVACEPEFSGCSLGSDALDRILAERESSVLSGEG